MSRASRAWTMWILVTALLLGGAYAIVARANPGLRISAEQVPVGLGH